MRLYVPVTLNFDHWAPKSNHSAPWGEVRVCRWHGAYEIEDLKTQVVQHHKHKIIKKVKKKKKMV